MKRFGLVLLLICTYSMGYSIHNDKHVLRSLECMGMHDYECAANEIPLIKNYSIRDSIALAFTDSLDQKIGYYSSVGEIDKCILYHELILSVIEKTKGQLSEDYLFYEQFLAMDFFANNDFPSAIQICEQALKGTNELNAEKEIKDMLYEMSYSGLGLAYYAMGHYDNAEENYLKNLTIIEEYYGKDSKEYYDISNKLFDIYRESGNNKKSIPYGIDNVNYCRTAYGEHSPEYRESLQFLSVAYFLTGDYVNAEPLAKQALEMYQSFDGDSTKIILYLNENLSGIYTHLANYKLAEQYALQAAEIAKSMHGENKSLYPQYLIHIGLIYKYLGDATKAEPYFSEAIELAKENNDSITLCQTIFELAEFYTAIGLYKDAESRYKECLHVLPADYREDQKKRQIYAKIINSLGVLYFHIGEYEKAEDCYFRSNQINFPIEGENSHNYGVFCNNMGVLYINLAKYDQAETYLLKALNTLSLLYNDSHPTYLITLNNLGLLYFTMGQYEKAESYYTKVLEARSKIYVGLHPDHIASIYKLGLLKSTTHDLKEAYAYFQKYAKNTKEYYFKGVDFMSEFQRVQYWNATHEKFEKDIAGFLYNYAKKDNKANSFAYDNELFTKGLLLNSSNAVTRSILESNDTTLIAQWNDLTTKKQQIIVLEQNDPQSEYVAQLRDEAEVLEKAITKSSAAYRENIRQWNITWDSVRNVLQPNQVAIEYMSAPLTDDSTMYCALLVRDTCTYPILIPLFNEPDVAGLLHTSTGDTAKIDATYQYHHNGRKLTHYIWDPVETYIHPGEEVFFSPTGVLHQIAIENLPYDSTQTYGDVYSLVRLSSTRELVLNKPAAPHEKAVLYGGILYEPMMANKMLANAQRFRGMETELVVSMANDTTQRSLAGYLPGTKKEIDAIKPILENSHISVTVYSRDTACEESFKALSGTKQNMLLLATHGFFWQDKEARKEQYFNRGMMQLDDEKPIITIDPLNRCGLLFAGANSALSGHFERLPKGVDDGILTAKEISVLDFRSTDIVVMSACETGLGDISGEGVFGLQRAFKMAGAQTILMTLWRVNDAATQLFMTSFFRYLNGHTKREAFRMAQQEVRNYKVVEERSSKGHSSTKDKYKNKGKNVTPQDETEEPVIETIITHPYQSPYYWAGFILLD